MITSTTTQKSTRGGVGHHDLTAGSTGFDQACRGRASARAQGKVLRDGAGGQPGDAARRVALHQLQATADRHRRAERTHPVRERRLRVWLMEVRA